MPYLTSDYINNFGNTYLSPWLSGEQIERTVAVLHSTFRRYDIPSSARDENGENVLWREPAMLMPNRNTESTVIHSRNGSNSIVISDNNDSGHIMLVHNSGAVVQIDSQGTILIKSFGDTYNHTEGTQFHHSAGDTHMNVGQNYNIMIEGGSNKIWVAGDMDIECENYLVTARGKVTFNAAQGVEMKGAKVSLESHTGNIDIASYNELRIGSQAAMSLRSLEAVSLQSDAAINILSAEAMAIQSSGGGISLNSSEELIANGSEVHLKGSTVYADDIVRLAQGGAADAAGAEEATPPAVVELREPPPSTMATTGDAPNGSTGTPITPRPLSLSGFEADDGHYA